MTDADTNCASSTHVHFDAKEVSTHESQIGIVNENGVDQVHLGFLQIRHVYDITFNLTHNLGKDITFDPLENLKVKVKETTPIEDGHQLLIEFSAQKEKLMKETITLRSAIDINNVHLLTFQARVLGKHKGTPSLRNGIHCIRVEPDDDENSDWQGF